MLHVFRPVESGGHNRSFCSVIKNLCKQLTELLAVGAVTLSY